MRFLANYVAELGKALCFFGEMARHVFRGHIRIKEVLRQMYEQGVQSVVIITLASVATGAVLAIQGAVTLTRFGAK